MNTQTARERVSSVLYTRRNIIYGFCRGSSLAVVVDVERLCANRKLIAKVKCISRIIYTLIRMRWNTSYSLRETAQHSDEIFIVDYPNSSFNNT